MSPLVPVLPNSPAGYTEFVCSLSLMSAIRYAHPHAPLMLHQNGILDGITISVYAYRFLISSTMDTPSINLGKTRRDATLCHFFAQLRNSLGNKSDPDPASSPRGGSGEP
jgi:hypothetical protein